MAPPAKAKKGRKKDNKGIETTLPLAIRDDDFSTAERIFRDAQVLQNPRLPKVMATALWLSCACDRYEIAKLLLENGIEPDVSVDGETPLMTSASEEIVELLVTHGANVNATDALGKTALMHAKNVAVAEALLRHNAAINKKDSDGKTALMHAVCSEGSSEVAHCLIREGADLSVCDSQGRTILITASWKSRVSIIKEAIRRGASVKTRDKRGRNILHHLCEDQMIAKRSQLQESTAAAQPDHDIIDLVLAKCDEADINAKEFLEKRTPLHWAVASNNLFLVKRLLAHVPGGAKVDAVDQRQRTALHIATSNDRIDIATELLKHKANVNARSDRLLTPLHVAADRRSDSAKIVRLLLKHNADVNCTTRSRKSALHAASEAGNIDVVKVLLGQPNIEAMGQDSAGNSPLLSAAKSGHKDIVSLLAQHGYTALLSSPELDAACGYTASIIEFASRKSRSKHGNIRRWRPVYNLLSGDFPVTPKRSASSSTRFNEPGDFRWIHLPSNNAAWCQQLLVRWFMEQDKPDVENFKRLQASFNHEHSGRELHAHYMRPVCQVIRAPCTEGGTRQEGDLSSANTPPRSTNKSKNPNGARRNTSSDATSTPGQSMYLFMPYVHCEEATSQQMRQQEIESAQKSKEASKTPQTLAMSNMRPLLQRHTTDFEASRVGADERSIHAHLQSLKCSLHIRRTLDQFFYRTISTHPRRDTDQVVLRYQEKHEERSDPHLLMVDQLWLWVVSEDLIITSFPRQWNESDHDPKRHNMLESIVNEINSPTRSQPISDVHELAMLIAGHCSGAFDRRNTVDGEHLFLDMFEASIGDAMNRETELFDAFEKASAEASEWLEISRGIPGHISGHRRSALGNRPVQKDDNAPEDSWKKAFSPRLTLLQTLLDIGGETEHLREIKDIRDELDILAMIFRQQQSVMDEMRKGIVGDPKANLESSSYQVHMSKIFDEQRKYIEHPLEDISRMDKQAERVYKSITDLLEHKQKHANAMQAADTARQGLVLMVFTVVTVIFLPMSFLASIFAINIKEFPHVSSGVPEMTFAYISKFVFGIGAAIAALCVVFAFFVDKFYSLAKRLTWKVWRGTNKWHVGRKDRIAKQASLRQARPPATKARSNASSFADSSSSSTFRLKKIRFKKPLGDEDLEQGGQVNFTRVG